MSISHYTTKFTDYPTELKEFAIEKGIPLLSITSMKGQALALMAQPEIRGTYFISREEAVAFFKQIGMETTDAIQQFNKPTGFKRISRRGFYCLKYPFEADTIDLDKRKGAIISGDRDASINSVKDWWRANLVDVPNDEWQIGHLDPTIGDASEKNLAYQPPIQGKYRNRFKWDPIFMKMWPTADELIPKLNEYYTDDEQKRILEALMKKYIKNE